MNIGYMSAVNDKVRYERVLDNESTENRTVFVECKDAVICTVACNSEDGLTGNARLVDLLACGHFIEVNESKLGHDVKKSVSFCHH
jgi:hypothetical protein